MSRDRQDELELRERRLLLRLRRQIAAQELELNRLEIRRKRLELAILTLVALLLVLSLVPGHTGPTAATLRDHTALDLGAFIHLRG